MSKTDEDVEDLPLDTPSEAGDTTAPETTATGSVTSLEGEEVLEEEVEEEVEEEEPEVYDSKDFISGPFMTEECTVPDNILVFDFSYGYDCKRYYNLTVADERTVFFASGNLIHMFDTEKRQMTFRRSAFGCGIGHIRKNPKQPHVAIAENGINPPIIVYEWPGLEIVCLLKGGAERRFSHLHYSPDGELLVSQAGEPDYLITVWNWPAHKILLRTKSNFTDVFVCAFSPFVEGQLVTCGLSHIKFWKMASTFTGLKLQGELGRFGKTEYSDIVAILPMPDEKVVSGCDWGNVLIWDEGLIKVEVMRKGRRRCHDAAIMHIKLSDSGELWTAALDGKVRVWYYDTIDQADPPDDDRVVMVEPQYEFAVPEVQFMCFFKQYADNPKDHQHFVQDGNGGIWRIDLNIDGTPSPTVQLFKCHAGRVVDIAVCPWGNYFVSFGEDGRIYVYNYLTQQLIYHHQFPAKGACLIWLPVELEPSGDEIFMAFDDGNIRSVILSIPDKATPSLHYFQIIKPHAQPITAMSLNYNNTLLVTGSEDKTIFVFQVENDKSSYTKLTPIGFVPVPDVVTCLTWYERPVTTILVGCIHGQFMEVDLPQEPQPYTEITFILKVEPRHQRFITYKAQIRRDIKIREIEARKAEKLARKMEEMEKVKAENPGLEIDEEVFLADSESEEELEPLFIPDIPNRILWMQLTPDNTIWLSMGGYDAGYIYEYTMDQKDEIPYRFQMVNDADDTEISSYVYNYNQRYHIMAMQDGTIRVNKVNPEDFRDLSDYWTLAMHDNYNGFVPKMCFSYDEKYFFSCGYDGNVFAYIFHPEKNDYVRRFPRRMKFSKKLATMSDENNYKTLSLEQAKVKAEEDRIKAVADEHKRKLRARIAELKLRYEAMRVRNENLLPTQILPREELEIDPRITKDLNDKFEEDLALVKRKLAFDVEKSAVLMRKLFAHFSDDLDYFPIGVYSIRKTIATRTLRQRKLGAEFYPTLELVEQKIIEEEVKGRPPERPAPPKPERPPVRKKERKLEYFLMGLSPSTIEKRLGKKLQLLLCKYRRRKAKWEKRQQEWDDFKFRKPREGFTDADDEALLQHARDTIGDYKLKSSLDYTVPKHLRETKLKKYKQLLLTRERQYNIRHDFNTKVYQARDMKRSLVAYLIQMQKKIAAIHEEVPEYEHKEGPALPARYEDSYIEKNLEVIVDIPEEPPEHEGDENNIVQIEELDYDGLEKEMLMDREWDAPLGDDLVKEFIDSELSKSIFEVDCETLTAYSANDEEDTPWEHEARLYRLNRKLYEQNQIILSMDSEIDNFDKHIDELVTESYQELSILKDFEAVEEELQQKVNSILLELIDIENTITKQEHLINDHKRMIEQLQEKEKELNEHFMSVVQNNKFYDFLRRIFRKRYKPPKETTGDSDSESESSSSSDESEEEETGSVDSRDFGIIRLDESVCPKGCDRTIYDLTFELRTQRHGVELELKEEAKVMDTLKKELELQTKKMKNVEKSLSDGQDDLERYQRLKQQKLNTVVCTAVLRLDQLQHLMEDGAPASIKDCLIFSKTKLTNLYKRVGQLQTETLQQKAKHRVNRTHMKRMRTDIKAMQKKIHNIKRDIIHAMSIRFGQVVDIDELEERKIMDSMGIKLDNIASVDEMEEALLKSIVRDLKLSSLDIKGLYQEEIDSLTKQYVEIQEEVKQTIDANTARIELLTVLNRERDELEKIVLNQPKKKEKLDEIRENIRRYKKDLAKLKSIIDNQNRQLEELRDEIKRLSTKGFTLPPKEIAESKIEEDEQSEEWMDYDQYMQLYGEEYAEEMEKRKKEIKLPKRTVEKSEQFIRKILQEMIDSIQIEMPESDIQILINAVLNAVINRSTIAEIINSILDNLPTCPCDEYISCLEMAAEKLFTLEEPEVTESDINLCARELMQEIIDDVMLTKGHPYEVMVRLTNQLVEQLPIDFLSKDENMKMLSEKMKASLSDTPLDKAKLVASVESITSAQRQEMNVILDKLLEDVYGIGIDYLYIIR